MKTNRNKPEVYFEFLKDVHGRISRGEKLLMGDLIKQYSLSGVVTVIMVSGGIIKNEGSKKIPKYVWTTCIPNIKMAETLCERTDLRLKRNNKEAREKAKGSVVVNSTPSSEEIIDLNLSVESPALKEEEAVLVLKQLGYRIMKPVTQWEEV